MGRWIRTGTTSPSKWTLPLVLGGAERKREIRNRNGYDPPGMTDDLFLIPPAPPGGSECGLATRPGLQVVFGEVS